MNNAISSNYISLHHSGTFPCSINIGNNFGNTSFEHLSSNHILVIATSCSMFRPGYTLGKESPWQHMSQQHSLQSFSISKKSVKSFLGNLGKGIIGRSEHCERPLTSKGVSKTSSNNSGKEGGEPLVSADKASNGGAREGVDNIRQHVDDSIVSDYVILLYNFTIDSHEPVIIFRLQIHINNVHRVRVREGHDHVVGDILPHDGHAGHHVE